MPTYQGSTVVKRRPKDGLPGKGISLVKEFYLATSIASGVTRETSGWKTNPSEAVLTSTNKYLWNYETITYTDGSFSNTEPVIIGTYGEDGRGIESITEFYLATSLSSGVSWWTDGWTLYPENAVLTPTNKYLWNYEWIKYTDGTGVNTYPVIIGTYGEKGDNGLPGPLMVQKEWVQGDTHRYTDEVREYFYVRGADAAQSYWYTLINKGTVIADAPPTGGIAPAGYKSVQWLKELSVQFFIAEEANLANLIFKDQKLISLRGTVNGVAADYSGQANFVPNIIIDGKTGKITAKNAEIQGQLKSNTSGSGIIIDPSDRSLKLTNNSGGVIAKLSSDLSTPVLVLGDWGGSSSAVNLSDDGLLVRVKGTSESDISFNKMSVFNSTGSIFEASVPYGYPLVVIMKNLPSSSTGLSTGRLWRDSNGFIRIVL